MGPEERLVGFDAREMWVDPATSWSEKRRADFLFRPDVPKPFSTDTVVWPSVFELNENTRPPDCFGHQDLCDQLADVQAHLVSVHRGRCYVIAITVFTSSPSEAQEWDELVATATPATRDNSWTLLGFDVSDQWLLSGLSNCGFVPEVEDVASLRAQWGPQLNRHHLFDSLDAATAFKDLSNVRVQEHAPFFVFGLWLVQEMLSDHEL